MMTPETPKLPDDAETDSRFPSGKWVGFWTQTLPVRAKPKQEMLLTFVNTFYETEGGRVLPLPWYTVAFRSRDLWADAGPSHTVLVDLWESHLEHE